MHTYMQTHTQRVMKVNHFCHGNIGVLVPANSTICTDHISMDFTLQWHHSVSSCVCVPVCVFLNSWKIASKMPSTPKCFWRKTHKWREKGRRGKERRWRKLIDFQMVNDEITEWKGEREKESSDGPVGKIKSQDSCWSRQRRRETLQKKKRKIQKEKRAWSSIVSRLSLTPK